MAIDERIQDATEVRTVQKKLQAPHQSDTGGDEEMVEAHESENGEGAQAGAYNGTGEAGDEEEFSEDDNIGEVGEGEEDVDDRPEEAEDQNNEEEEAGDLGSESDGVDDSEAVGAVKIPEGQDERSDSDDSSDEPDEQSVSHAAEASDASAGSSSSEDSETAKDWDATSAAEGDADVANRNNCVYVMSVETGFGLTLLGTVARTKNMIQAQSLRSISLAVCVETMVKTLTSPWRAVRLT